MNLALHMKSMSALPASDRLHGNSSLHHIRWQADMQRDARMQSMRNAYIQTEMQGTDEHHNISSLATTRDITLWVRSRIYSSSTILCIPEQIYVVELHALSIMQSLIYSVL
jgi:hypothetical protein